MTTATIGTRRSAVEIIFDTLSVCADGGANETSEATEQPQRRSTRALPVLSGRPGLPRAERSPVRR
jgi:hypothetical protein